VWSRLPIILIAKMNGTEVKLEKANVEDLKEHKVNLEKAVTGQDF